jgi:hypothetical protein
LGAPTKGGEAHVPISHPAEESRPRYSPDGTKLASGDLLESTRSGFDGPFAGILI